MFDAIIIGAGVSGSSIARELSRYDGKFLVVEKEKDVSEGSSKANSGIVHAGHDAVPGTMKAKFNIAGSKMMPQIAKDLDVPYMQCGSLVVALKGDAMEKLEALKTQGEVNGVERLAVISRERVKEMEPNISDEVIGALWAPTGGIVCPYNLTIAFAENANTNGVEFKLETRVEGIEPIVGGWRVTTNKGTFETKAVVNAAGVYADVIHNMVSDNKMTIIPRRGDYCLLDKTQTGFVHSTIFQLPNECGKGVLVTPTTHGNILIGPTAVDVTDKEATNTTEEGLEFLQEKANHTVANIPLREVITSFAGLRAHTEKGDFIVEEVEGAKGFYDCAGIESPGLSASPAIGVYVADLVQKQLQLPKNENFNGIRKGILKPNTLTLEERNLLIEKQPAYGTIVCRCEKISEGEIIDAIKRPLGATTIDGIKRRTRAGMGRCQAGFCSPKTMAILERELDLAPDEVVKSESDSAFVVGVNKDEPVGGADKCDK